MSSLAAFVSVVCASAAACGNSSGECERVASAPDSTWAAVQTNHAYCNACASDQWSVGTCGGYNVLSYVGPDTGGQAFFDAASGQLAGAVAVSNGIRSCWVYGSAAFSPPADCSFTGTAPDPPQWCSPDAGAANEQVFPCCQTALEFCVNGERCPPTWGDVPAAIAPCGANRLYPNPEVGECGGYHVLRIQFSVSNLWTVYYDATTNAPVAVIDSTGLCVYGSMEGVTLPACTPTFVSACPGGGADAGTDGP